MNEFVRIPLMGNQLILDFHDVTCVNICNYEELNSEIRKILSQSSVKIHDQIYKKLETGGLFIIYFMSDSHFFIRTFPSSKSCIVDFYCEKSSIENLKIIEEMLCDLFEWKNCTSTNFMKRGQMTSLSTNDFIDKSEILRNVKFIHREKSEFQDIRVYDVPIMGRIMILDGYLQFATKHLGESDVYTKSMCKHLDKEKLYDHVIIIGGGDLIIASYLLSNFSNIKKLTVCDIDSKVQEITRKYFEIIGDVCEKEIQNGRLEIEVNSGLLYLQQLIKQNKQNTVGAIIVDSTDFVLEENSIASELFTPEFYSVIYRLLIEGCGFSQQINEPSYIDSFKERVKIGGFSKIDAFVLQTVEYGGTNSLAFGFK